MLCMFCSILQCSLNFVNRSTLWAFWPLCRIECVTQKRERRREEVFFLFIEAADCQIHCDGKFVNRSILWAFWTLCRLERVTRKRERKREEVFFLFRGRRPSKLLRRPYTAFSRHTHTLTLSTVKLFIILFRDLSKFSDLS